MSKRKTKGQKKKFFSHPKNKNRLFKKKEVEPVSDGNTLRRRGNYSVLSTEGIESVPQCSHGPCLLFGLKENGAVTKRYFSCAIYRNDAESCAFKAHLNDDNTLGEVENPVEKVDDKWAKKEAPIDYGCIPKKMKVIPKGSLLVFCRQCNDVFEKKHKCPSEVVRRKQLKSPSVFLEPLDSHTGEAQFFFSDQSVDVIVSAIRTSGQDGVLCIGAPRIFEAIRNDKTLPVKLFMLDYDKRYAHFFPSTQYAQYSMLVDHFYDNKAERKLMNFFEKCDKVLLVCDPPFGAFMEPLMETIEKMKARHLAARKEEPSTFKSAVIVPYFVGKHIVRAYKDVWMSDFRVTYTNHKVYSKESKTTVRVFTNLDKSVFDMKDLPSYQFCEMCELYVHKSNKHCFMCGLCTSIDGSLYKHCERCMRCVKNSYKHCRECSHCHQVGRCSLAAGRTGTSQVQHEHEDYGQADQEAMEVDE